MSTDNLEGRFTMKGQLRCQGVGSLVCAEDKHDGSRTAIRLIPELAQGPAAVAAALKMPVHPVLPRTIGSGAFNGSAWVAIDFPEGELLAQKGPLDTGALLTMGSMVAGALTALHQNGIVHGELSSESVLVVPAKAANSERFVLFDAPLVVMNRLTDRRGEERLLSQLTHLVPYLSPERARGVEASQPSDVWALGMVLSLASGAKGVPGDSTLEKIAAIVTNKWRPAVSGALPIALRLLLTRMLAPDPKDRPSSLDVALELEHLCVAFNAHHAVKPETAQTVDTAPMAQFRIAKLADESNKISDPFEALVAAGVTAKEADPHAEPTKQVVVPLSALSEVTDPRAPMPLPGPTAPERGPKLQEKLGQVVTQPAGEPAVPAVPVAKPSPLKVVEAPKPVVAAAAAATVRLTAEEVAAMPMPVIAPQHPSQRRTPMPLPPILDPNAVVVAPQPMRPATVAPMPKVSAVVHEVSQPQTETMRYGALPGAVRPPKVPQQIETEDVAEEAAQARAELRAEQAAKPVPVLTASMPAAPVVVNTDVNVPSVHDQAEDAFAASVRNGQKRRLMAVALAAGVVILVGGGLLLKSALSGDAVDPQAQLKAAVKKAKAEREREKKVVAVAEPAPEPAAEEEVMALPEPTPEPVAAKPEPKPEPVAAKPEPKQEPVAAKPEPKPEPVAKAEPKPAKAEKSSSDLKRPAEAVEAKPAPRAKAVKKEEAPRRPASRLDEGD